ncbi:MAG: HNH endonuclease [Planctomycetaceae bacterium]|nr:HNH endonuclease [Planctomycetaceae bacterium]
MSYEGNMLAKFAMPSRKEVEEALLITLFKHNGVVKEFSSGEEIVNEIADIFLLNEEQRGVVLERIYKKENRTVKTPLWHRLLFRAADALAKENLITRPTTTVRLTNKKEWMLTEEGYDKVLKLQNISLELKDHFHIHSYEVQKAVKHLSESICPQDYNPLKMKRESKKTTRETSIRLRSFRQAVIESYDHCCCICGLKMKSPDSLSWEVEAAHIVPCSSNGKDDIWNGVALCRLHHWAFDVGWFSLTGDYQLLLSSQAGNIPDDHGKIGESDFFKIGLIQNKTISLPGNHSHYPHVKSIEWHRNHVFFP